MSLGTKIILLFAFFFVLHSLFSYGIRKVVEEPTHINIERQMMLREVEWFFNTLTNEINKTELLCRNFAAFEGLYDYILNPSKDFEDRKFDDDFFISTKLNVFIILDNDNAVVYSRLTDDDFLTPTKIDGFSTSSWSQQHPLLGFEQSRKPISGLLKVRENVVITASSKVYESPESEKTGGTMIVGRLLNEKHLQNLTEIQGINAKVVSVAEAGFREGEKITEGYFYTENLGDGTYTALLAINDVAFRPSLAIKANLPSTISGKSKRANTVGLFSGLAFTFISLMLVLFLVYHIMGKRLENLIDHIIGIRHSGVLVKIVQESNGDEIDLLGYEFNQMVTRLQRDIELRTQVENELKRSLAELERFADVASHDLQEPLRSVASCLQLLEMQYKDKIDDQGKQLIEYAVQGSRRMKNLIKALLAYSNIGNTGLEITTCNCNQIAADAANELKKEIDDSKAQIICEELPVIQADKFRLQLLFSNIIHNAIKYAVPAQSPVIKITSEKIDKTWRFAIEDNGIGIDKEYFTQIFVAFKRLHTQDQYEGSGIGLAICRRIIEQHRGRIWVKSEPGKGSTFYFSIPV